MSIEKSTRHQKIIGEFGEHLVCNWLSRSGYEVARVDHTGIDVIAFSAMEDQRLGITVKSRTRIPGTEEDHVNLLVGKDRAKLLAACDAFGCEPWIAVYVETMAYADLFLLSLKTYDDLCTVGARKPTTWAMKRSDLAAYDANRGVGHLRMHFEATNWLHRMGGPPIRVKDHLSRLTDVLPDDAGIDDLIYELTFMHGIERALTDPGPTIPHEEVEKRIKEWTRQSRRSTKS